LAGRHTGLKIKQPPHVILSAYQGSIVRNFHDNYDRALGLNDLLGGDERGSRMDWLMYDVPGSFNATLRTLFALAG
jgi:hypothetical protein